METATKNHVKHIAGRERPKGEPRAWLVFAALAGIFLLNLLLRVFYLRYDFVNGDEAVRALTATGWLDGARLYVDIVTDKPPGATFFYAAVFALFGRSMMAVHLVAAVWNFFTAMTLYAIAARHYGRRAGLWAALLYTYFSTNYLTQDMMAANTELLMALPYTAAFYLYLRTIKSDHTRLNLFAAGLLTGVAVLCKPQGIFNLAFFGLFELLLIYQARKSRRIFSSLLQAIKRLAVIVAGVAVVFAALSAWLRATGALADFWRSVFEMNTFYISSMPPGLWLKFFVGRTLGYVFFNLALWSLAVYAAWRAVALWWRGRNATMTNGDSATPVEAAPPNHAATRTAAAGIDLAILFWAVASLAPVFAGGRFFGHYFIQALPALSLLAARGVGFLREALADAALRRRAKIVTALLLLCFLIGFVRFHQRTAILAYEFFTGARTQASGQWGMTKREEEAEIIARQLRREVGAGGSLYIWDYALDVYWRTQTRPAARFITPNHVTGVFTDAETRPATPEEAAFWAESRRRLIEDLRRSRPPVILDVTGGLMNLPYTDLVDFVRSDYRQDSELGVDPVRPFVVYRLKD